MSSLLLRIFAVLLFPVSGCSTLSNPDPASRAWQAYPVIPGGRIDAIADLGDGVVIAGSRNPKPGHIFRSTDCGETWVDLGNLLGEALHTGSVTCVASGGEGVAYLLTGDAHVWKSENWGATWSPLGQVSNMPRHEGFHHSYSMTVLPSGTVLVSNTNPTGGHVFRSEDGGASWQTIGPVSPMALYRFETVQDGVLLNGWSGRVYKSTDDGKTWRDQGQLSEKALYATVYLGKGIALQGGEDGRLFRSTDDGESWGEVARFADSADDFVQVGAGEVIYTTYTGEKNLYLSKDYGLTWENMGPVPSGAEGDTWDHAVPVRCGKSMVAVGGTSQGRIVTWR